MTYLAQSDDPADQLRRLFTLVLGHSRENRIELALMASITDPAVGAAVERVTQRRIRSVADLFARLGAPPGRAWRQGVFAVSVYLGHLQLAHAAPQTLPAVGVDRDTHVEERLSMLPGSGLIDRA
ncbi:MAG: hypothetical protein ACRYG2_13590 [Janthinobacterium lividum]